MLTAFTVHTHTLLWSKCYRTTCQVKCSWQWWEAQGAAFSGVEWLQWPPVGEDS